MSQPRLILFDIDCTLLRTAGSGMAALEKALRTLWSGPYKPAQEVRPDGQTDPKIVQAMLSSYGVPPSLRSQLEARLLASYPEFLAHELSARRHQSRLEVGVLPLLSRLSQTAHCYLGVLTGNLQITARMKLDLFELNSHFPIGAFGCDHRERNQLGPIALKRAQEHFGQEFSVENTWLVGDTDKDILAARALGARVLAVATGSYSVDQLSQLQPDACMEDLSDTEKAIRLLGGVR